MLNKRDLKYDYKIYKKAFRFAGRISKLAAEDQKSYKIGKLFTSIGKAHSVIIQPLFRLLLCWPVEIISSCIRFQ